MNSLFNNIEHLFTLNSLKTSFKETDIEANLSFECKELSFPRYSDLIKELFFINLRDIFSISIKIDDENLQFIGNNDAKEYEAFCQSCNSKNEIKSNETINVSFNIIKKNVDNNISIYSVDDFIIFLRSKSIKEFLYILNKCMESNSRITFEAQCEEVNLQTASISFVNKGLAIIQSSINCRSLRKEQVKNLCHCELLIKYRFIPEDFHVIENDKRRSELTLLFNLLELIYSLIYLFDVIEVKDDSEIFYKLSGYKAVSNLIKYGQINSNSNDTYFNIYKWTYTGGNIHDKIGLSRNIISLHLQTDNLFLPISTFDSIHSGYKIYQKENIKQYIEIRNKISDQLLDFKNRADTIIENFASDFKKSLFAFVSFYASVIVIRVVSKGDFIGAFTIETTLLSFCFLLITFFVMLASRWELKKQANRYIQSYNNLKKRYTDLLNQEDIKKILNNDIDFSLNLDFINEKKKIYTLVWSISLVIILFSTLFLYFINNNINYINIIKDVLYRVCYYSINHIT